MALLSLSPSLLSSPSSAHVASLVGPSSSSSSSSSSTPPSSSVVRVLQISVRLPSFALTPPSLTPRRIEITRHRLSSHVVRMAPDEEKMTRRSPLDFPIEWERPKPGRRPDIFPQFSPMKTPLPPPMPADPPEEDEEEEEKKEEEEEDPEKEDNPDQPKS